MGVPFALAGKPPARTEDVRRCPEVALRLPPANGLNPFGIVRTIYPIRSGLLDRASSVPDGRAGPGLRSSHGNTWRRAEPPNRRHHALHVHVSPNRD